MKYHLFFLWHGTHTLGSKYLLIQSFKAQWYYTIDTICTTRFNIQQFYVLPTQCIYVFCVDLRTNSDYFPVHH